MSQSLPAEDSAAIRKQIEFNYEKMKKAALAHSVDAVNECRKEVETDDAIFINTKGDIHPIRAVGEDYAAIARSVLSYEYAIKKFAVSGNEADVWVDVKEMRAPTARAGVGSPPPPQRRVVFIQHTKDTWINTPAGWRRNMREEVAPSDRTVEDAPATPPATK
jgi:hypothetical protein